ncbi:hypothetical protein E2C01_019848 [Portunus trituberculatus]|uniref:Uncharacterized protein n=1 Tax=Portunus trituberculatus TaxID=210409 RepID=A0A5B7DYC5_PORTR|nr:hypothetical protein [Portunus trituberculatus]
MIGSTVCLPSPQLIEPCCSDHPTSSHHHSQHGKFYENQPYYCCRRQCLHPLQALAIAVKLRVKDVIIHLRFLCFHRFHGIVHILFWYYIFHWFS